VREPRETPFTASALCVISEAERVSALEGGDSTGSTTTGQPSQSDVAGGLRQLLLALALTRLPFWLILASSENQISTGLPAAAGRCRSQAWEFF
jgi:hypothetical protein